MKENLFMISKRLSVISIIVLLWFTLAGCSGRNSDDQQTGPPIPRVEVVQPYHQSLSSTLMSSGTIASRTEVRVIAQTEGKITMLEVEEGHRVREGEIIVQLDDSVPRAQYREAEASFREAQRNFERAEQLYERNLISEQEYQNIVTQKQIAESRYEYRKALFDYTTIRSPINGVITYRGVDRGDIASPRDHLLTVSNLEDLVIRVNVSELEAPYLRPGDEVRVRVDAYRDSQFTGRIRRVFPAADPDTRLIPIEIELINRDERLFPGLFARVELQSRQRENVLVVPVNAVLTNPQGERFVYTVNDDTAHYRKITVGMRTDQYIEVVDGLSEEDKVVIRGAGSLRDRTPVQLITER
jgi:membrane fusion protein, multidrug efflux system